MNENYVLKKLETLITRVEDLEKENGKLQDYVYRLEQELTREINLMEQYVDRQIDDVRSDLDGMR